MFIVCSGGCPTAADQYFNLSIDVKRHVSCRDFCNSEVKRPLTPS